MENRDSCFVFITIFNDGARDRFVADETTIWDAFTLYIHRLTPLREMHGRAIDVHLRRFNTLKEAILWDEEAEAKNERQS